MDEIDKYIWISDEEYEWLPGKIIGNEEENYKIEIKHFVDNQSEIRLVNKNEEFIEIHPSCLKGVDDLLLLGDFNKQTLLHNTRERFAKDQIYSFIGTPILIAVNPYKRLPIYDESFIKYYKDYFMRTKTNFNKQENPVPHLFHIAEAAYQDMIIDKSNQCIIISGESGSGKTESTKIILKYLAMSSIYNNNNKVDSDLISVEKQVLDSNPILEAFGNAKTVRNNNSSRFGKFIKVNFTDHGKIISAKIYNYLLEKSRIVTLQKDERNYHIFYQLLKGADESERKKYYIGSKTPDYFFYLSQSGCYEVEEENDKDNFKITKECLLKLNFKPPEIHFIFTIIMGILYLGNIEFIELFKNGIICADLDQTKIDFKIAAEMLGVEREVLKSILIVRKMLDKSSGNYLEICLSVDAAYDMRDGLAKLLYSKLFNWLVRRINDAISNKDYNKENPKNINTKYIGLLDIFGFENFTTNSFEQLCINYANERLQQFFNNHIFKLEQEEYKKEKIDWSNVEFVDNLEIVNLIDNPSLSIFSLLDSEGLLKSTDDNAFRNKIYANLFDKNEFLGKTDEGYFLIHHYAGDVFYDVYGFILKNNDNISRDLQEAMEKSKNKLISKLFSGGSSSVSNKIQSDTLSKQFKKQLDELLKMLSQSNPRYVKCIKPNSFKQPKILDSFGVGEQLLSAGVLEAIKIRKKGFSIRRNISEFVERYLQLTPMIKNNNKNEIIKSTGNNNDDTEYVSHMRKLCIEMIKNLSDIDDLKPYLKAQPPLLQIGVTKVFMKEEIKNALEYKLNRIKYIYRIQSTVRMFFIKNKIKYFRRGIKKISSVFIGFIYRKKFKKIRKVIKIQRFYRHFKNKIVMMHKLKRLVIEAKKAKIKQSICSDKIINNNVEMLNSNRKNICNSNFNNLNYTTQNSSEKESTRRSSHKVISDDNTITFDEVLNNLNLLDDFNPRLTQSKKTRKNKTFLQSLTSIPNMTSIVDSELTSTLQSLNEELKTLHLEKENNHNMMLKYKEQSENKDKQIEVLESKLKHMKEVVYNCEDEMKEMNIKMNKFKESNETSHTQHISEDVFNKLKEENLLLKKSQNEKESQIEILNMKLNELSNNNSNLSELNNNLKDQITKRKEKEEKEISKLLQQINEMTKEKYEMERKYKENIEIGGNVNMSNVNSSFLSNIDPALSSLTLTNPKNISYYRKQVSQLKTENKNLNQKFDEFKTSTSIEFENLKYEISEKNLKLNEFITDSEKIENEINLIKQENSELIELNKKLKEISQDSQIKISVLEKNSNNKNELSQIKSELESIIRKKENEIMELSNTNEDYLQLIARSKNMELALRNELKLKENEISKRNEIIREIQEELDKAHDESISNKKEIFNLKNKFESRDNDAMINYENSIKNKNQEIFILKEKEAKYEKFISEMKDILKKKQILLDNKKQINMLLVDVIKMKKGEVQCLEALKFTTSSTLKENLKKMRENEKLLLAKVDEITNNLDCTDDYSEDSSAEEMSSDEFNSSREDF